MIDFQIVEKEWQNDPEYQKALQELRPEFEIANILIEARKNANLTQTDVAKRMNVTQSRVAKIESGINVSVDALKRYATATGTKLKISLDPAC